MSRGPGRQRMHAEPDGTRRRLLAHSGAATLALSSAAFLHPALARAASPGAALPGALNIGDWNKTGFAATTASDAIRQLGTVAPAGSKDILIDMLDVIENGARTRIEVTSRIADTEAISIVIDRNPLPLAAIFTFANGAEPYVSTLLKVAESGTLRVIVKAAGRLYVASREVRVTIGGCG